MNSMQRIHKKIGSVIKSGKKSRAKSNPNQRIGQSIIEVLIATLIVGTVLTAIASGLTLSLKNTSETKYRELATNLSQEGLEVFRRERNNIGWTGFTEILDSNTFCLNTLPANTTEFQALPAGECSGGTAIAGTTFTRTAYVVVQSQDVIQITVEVAWTDAQKEQKVSVVQEFRNVGGK